MNLIIDADLVNPPTLMGSFRDLTFFATKFKPHYDVLIQCPKSDTDMYYRYLKNYIGGLDFIRSFIDIGEEKGITIATRQDKYPNILIDRVTPENLQFVLRRIGFRIF